MSPTRKRPAPKQLWVMPHEDGWQAKHAGKTRAAIIEETKEKAVKKARQMAKRNHDELVITDKHNVIRQKDSEGNDPQRSPG